MVLKAWRLPIEDNDCSCWPTPTINGNYNRRGSSENSGDGLSWPTPAAALGIGGEDEPQTFVGAVETGIRGRGSRVNEFTALHLFAGIGGGALGFQNGLGEFAGHTGHYRTLAGIDVDPAACEDFERITGTAATQLDLFGRSDYIAFHGKEPAPGWTEAAPRDIWNACNGETPDTVFLSPPCKGFSGLLPSKCAVGEKYQALNRLTVRGLRLVLKAFSDDLPSLILLENVPRIQSRGASLLSEIKALLHRYGYVTNDASHDCGELGGLGQHRKRYLLIARNERKMDNFVYVPPKRRVRSIGEILEALPMPDDVAGGAMHRLPRLAWKTWVRLALIPAGGDWRDLQKLDHTKYRLEYVPRGGAMGMQDWEQPCGTVTGATGWGRSNAPTAVADPRFDDDCAHHNNVFRVTDWDSVAGTVTGASHVANGGVCVADPRLSEREGRHPGVYKVQRWTETSDCVTGTRFDRGAVAVSNFRVKAQGHPGGYGVLDWDKASPTVRGAARIMNTSASIADPRLSGDSRYTNKFELHGWNQTATTVTGTPDIQSGAPSIADPRLICSPRSGMMGVQAWDEPGKTVIGSGDVHSGAAAIADPRIPEDAENGVWVIVSTDGTWHRPLTTYELAMLQGFPMHLPSGEPFQLTGKNDGKWRERIGNAVPPPAAQAIAEVALTALMAAKEGMWTMSAEEIWVVPAGEELDIRVQ